MDAAQYQTTSMNGVVNEVGAGHNSTTIARRSISIFSRRGTETPEPKPLFIAQAAMAPSKSMTARQKSWIRRRRSITGGSMKQSKTQGTILRAVPPAAAIRMTALEQEMATSPNEEIMSAVSERTPSNALAFDASCATSPTRPSSSSWEKSATSSKHKSKRSLNDRIGVWVNGVAKWDDDAQTVADEASRDQSLSVEQEMGLTPVRPLETGSRTATRPTLSVVIPSSELHMGDRSVSTVVQPQPQRPAVAIAPAAVIEQYTLPIIGAKSPARRTVSAESQTSVALSSHTELSQPERPRTSRASSSSLSTGEHDDTSVYSKRSSATSIEPVGLSPELVRKHLEIPDRTASKAFLIESPAQAGVFDDTRSLTLAVNKPLPPNPIPPPRRSTPYPPVSRKPVRGHVKNARSTSSAPGGRPSVPMGTSAHKAARSVEQLDLVDQAFVRASPYLGATPSEPSCPTLSQAEEQLQAQLLDGAIGDSEASVSDSHHCRDPLPRAGSLRRSESVRSVMQPPSRAPTVPKRSRKREWRKSGTALQVVQLAKAPERRHSDASMRTHAFEQSSGITSLAVSPLKKCNSTSELPKTRRSLVVPSSMISGCDSSIPVISVDDGLVVVEGPVIMRALMQQEDTANGPTSARAAEGVLLSILSAITSLDDLAATAQINKGMYRVYKENEMVLFRDVLHNASSAAWEFREWCPPERKDLQSSKASSQLEHTPFTYKHCHKRDLAVMQRLKQMIVAQCQTFIRRETAWALSIPNHPHAQRFEDAFWRIWCFCKIFGCGKGREEDITGQLDWLKGGLLANQQGCGATVGANYDFEMTSVLLNAPEHFAKGNGEGLTAEQLYDMTEIWTCMVALLSPYQERTDEARASGVFEFTGTAEGVVEKEAQMLEEWTAYLLTLGPAVVFEMAEHATDTSSSKGFVLASLNGWTNWKAPAGGNSRSTFLKEPAARLYEERIASLASQSQKPGDKEKKEAARTRVSSLAAEIRLARQTSGYKRLPLIDMNSERAMSMMSRKDSAMSTRSSRRHVSTPVSAMSPMTTVTETARPLSPTAWSPRKISPIIEDRVECFNRMSLQNFAGLADDTGERAVKKIVDMGFTAQQARDALRVTDMGDGLRVDRAVDLLLRNV